MPGKGVKGKKRKMDETSFQELAKLEGKENPAFETSVAEENSPVAVPSRDDSRQAQSSNVLKIVIRAILFLYVS